jgi:hypothetical protein
MFRYRIDKVMTSFRYRICMYFLGSIKKTCIRLRTKYQWLCMFSKYLTWKFKCISFHFQFIFKGLHVSVILNYRSSFFTFDQKYVLFSWWYRNFVAFIECRAVDPDSETLWIRIRIGNPGKKIKKFQWIKCTF